ncbi:MAG TPA: cache domain-containing protein [Methanoregulaceae archaeon]|nr:cache domain-containing protein [Methanoregulaceae archaeon]
MRSIISFPLLVVLAFLLLSAGCVQDSGEKIPPTQSPAQTQVPDATVTDLVTFVEDARTYAQENGREAALAEFNKPNGSFIRGDLYVFAYDYQGNVLALPFQPELIGTSRWDIQDIKGQKYIREMTVVARNGSGFVHYIYPNPAEQYAFEPKLSYVTGVDEDWWLGSGIYLASINATEAIGMAPMTKEQIEKFVEAAVLFARQNDKETAIETFQNKSGPFVEGEIYIYALDFHGNVLALPFQPDLVGTNMLNITDATGQPFTRVEIDVARKGGGFVYYLYPNPARNFSIEPKMSYVQNVDDTYWIGAGTYLATVNTSA